MKLANSFRIARPPAEVFDAFLDIERIATCMPGSRLLGQPAKDTYEGEVKVKVGPLGVAYSGQLILLSAERDALTLTMRAKGREQHGAGNADAHVVAQLSEDNGETLVEIVTDLSIRGKVAQFGRGVIGEVTDGIIAKFAKNVEEMLTTGGSGEPLADTSVPGGNATAGAPFAGTEAVGGESLDAWGLIVLPMLKRHAGTVVPAVLAGITAYLGARAGARSDTHRRASRYHQ